MDIKSALAILTDALIRCREEDMRTAEVFAALEFLAFRTRQQWAIDHFRDVWQSATRKVDGKH
jgi:hypothetical protein